MAGEDWRRLADYVVARRVELGMRDRRTFAEATTVTERTLGKARERPAGFPQHSRYGGKSPRLGPGLVPVDTWQAASLTRHRGTAGAPSTRTRRSGTSRAPRGPPPDVVRGLVALARNCREGEDRSGEQARRQA